MKQELTPDAKRIIINWLRSGYYDLSELDTGNTEPMTIEQINDEYVRLFKCTDRELYWRCVAAVHYCNDCDKVIKFKEEWKRLKSGSTKASLTH